MAVAIRVVPSWKAGKKWAAVAAAAGRGANEAGWAVHFGAAGYEDYTQHGDAARMRRYLVRHRRRESWGISGVRTAGFWARWLLWNRPSLRASVRDMHRRFPSLRITLARGAAGAGRG